MGSFLLNAGRVSLVRTEIANSVLLYYRGSSHSVKHEGNSSAGASQLSSRYRNKVFSSSSPLLPSTVIRCSASPQIQDILSIISPESQDMMSTVGGLRKYRFYQGDGYELTVMVVKEANGYRVRITASSMQKNDGLFLHWSIFGSNSISMDSLGLKELPLGTEIVAGSFRTAFTKLSSGLHTLEFDLRANYAPCYIGMSSSTVNETRNATDFIFPVGSGRGQMDPLGVSIQHDGSVNFSLFSKHATSVTLCLYRAGSPQPSVELDLQASVNRTGNTWHIELDDIGSFDRYGYRCKGDTSWDKGFRFHPRRILLDPYVKAYAPVLPGQENLPSPAALLGLLNQKQLEFDWEDDVPPSIPLEEIMAYRLNVSAFTADKSSGLEESVSGTFEGILEKIQHLKNLGVNSIILQPIFAFQKQKGFFHPLSFFTSMDIFGPKKTSVSASISLKKTVRELHKNGFEVLLDVMFTHTGENNDEAPETISFRGIDNAMYYILDGNGRIAGSESGTENCFNCNHPVVQTLILDSLRHWVSEYHIDGFCFLNASALTKGPHGQELSRPVLVEAIAFDPVLSKCKLFADISSPFKRLNKELNFPHWKRWCLWNSKYRDDVRRFIRGDKGQLSGFATRLCGSGDILADGMGPIFSLNHITSPYGFTLVDLVSFSANPDAALEWSWNCGEEGRTLNQAVLNVRVKQIRNFLTCLYLSQGIPVLNMGDEYGLSKGGSIAVDQRRAFNWDALNLDFGKQISFLISKLCAFRSRRKDLFQRREFIKLENIHWHGIQPNQPDWDSMESSYIAVTLHPEQDASKANLGDVYIGFNSGDVVVAILPDLPPGLTWYRIGDTSLTYPQNFVDSGVPLSELNTELSGPSYYKVESFSSVLFEARGVV